ncbi:MAG TPA: ribonuclease III [Coriobacteriia bacterium]
MAEKAGTHTDVAETAARLGLEFNDPALLQRAFTHPSWSEEMGGESYERLEFLGDSVLGFLVADLLHGMFPDAPEGQLTRMKISLVRGRTLADVARTLGLDEAVRLGRGAERSGDRHRSSVLEAVFEALVGALYLDSGVDAARAFVKRAMGERASETELAGTPDDPKPRLQEALQAAGRGLPRYVTRDISPTPQEPRFDARAMVGELEIGSGSGRSKQSAERKAASDALRAMGETS